MAIFTPFKGISPRIWVLALVNLINRSGSMIMCFLSLYITGFLQYNIKQAGYAMSVYGLGAVLGHQLGGYFTDKVGYQRVQITSLIATGLMMLWLMQVRNFYALCAVLFVLNTVSEAFRPANTVAIGLNSNETNRTRSFSLMRLAFNLAVTFALTMGGWLITKGWNYIFIADAVTCFAAAATLLLFVPQVQGKIPKSGTATAAVALKHSPYQDKTYMLFTFGTFLSALVFMQIVWTLPPFFKEVYQWNEFTIGWVSAINGAVVLLTEMPLVHRIERLKPALWIIRLGAIVYAGCYLVLTLPDTYKWVAAVCYMVFISFGEILVMPFSTTWATRRAPKTQEGKYMAVYGIAYAVANIVAPLLGTQIIYHFGYNTLWVFIAAVSLLSWFIFGLLHQKENQHNTQTEPILENQTIIKS